MPRFEIFRPNMTANIYAVEAALVRIECQQCRHTFDVAFTSPAASDPLPPVERKYRHHPMLRDYIRAEKLHYGDPPDIRCCAGASMNSVPLYMLEYWVKPYALGEGLASIWPRKPVCGDPKNVSKPLQSIVGDGVTHFRREREFERFDLRPDWAR